MMNDPKTKKALFSDEQKKKPMMNDPKTKKALGGAGCSGMDEKKKA